MKRLAFALTAAFSLPTAALAAPDAGTAPDARLGMMERHAIWKAKKEADEKLAAELAAQERARLMKYDKARIPKHRSLLAFVIKTRAQLDDAAAKLKGKPDAQEKLVKLAGSQRGAIEKQGKVLRSIDPKGGSSNIATDHDVSLNYLANDYPAALIAWCAGDEKAIAELRADLDKRRKKVESWLDEIAKAKK